MKKGIILDIITALLLLLFAYTGLSKLLTPGIMQMDLMKPEQPKLLYSLRYVLPYAVPLTELVVVVLLLLPKYRLWGYWGSLLLMTVFTLYVGYILFFFHGIQRPCTCGGIFRELTWRSHFIVNLFYTVISLWAILLERRKEVKEEVTDIDVVRYNISQ